ncbi:MAG TPA: carboxymuconolactone decarboxylase family protein [Caulobacteraceae bacterium]|nr:carboxymuconolactone decarboxylase family protein [Caulobacteraceae bacterium]
MNRLLDIAPEDRTPAQAEAFERVAAGRGKVPTPYRVWIHSPDIALGMEQIGTYLNTRSHLSRREIEMGILLIATHWGGEYVLNNHIRAARKAGFDDAAIEALRSGERLTLADAHEQAFYDFAAATVAGAKPSDEDYARYERMLGRAGIAETLVLLGYYSAVSLSMKIHDVPLLAGD